MAAPPADVPLCDCAPRPRQRQQTGRGLQMPFVWPTQIFKKGNELSAFKNWKNSYKTPDFWVPLKENKGRGTPGWHSCRNCLVAVPFRQGKHYPVQSGPAPTTASCFIPGSFLGGPFSSDPVGIEVYTPGPKAPLRYSRWVPLAPGLTLEPWKLGSISYLFLNFSN